MMTKHMQKDKKSQGILEFGLTFLKNTYLHNMAQGHDDPILKHLKDRKALRYWTQWQFHKSANKRIRSYPDDSYAFSFDGQKLLVAQNAK